MSEVCSLIPALHVIAESSGYRHALQERRHHSIFRQETVSLTRCCPKCLSVEGF
jgi:hypothetical protein